MADSVDYDRHRIATALAEHARKRFRSDGGASQNVHFSDLRVLANRTRTRRRAT
jgi:hypothetical protein